ncbi:MAG: aminotransferase class I/II-fold pyridoxal phosphate-dependent enzyme [Saprospiraceae bacterium]|nr:aminotransferase class I/II-fold pyridoxal phosphate-dependent enzyme [Saprospiraceae bacterium]
MTDMALETLAIRTQISRSDAGEHSAPIFLTSSFVFDTAEDLKDAFDEVSDAHVYSRYSNPNVDEFVEKVALLEGAETGVAMASGMAAIYTTFMALLQSGDHIVSCSSVFGATHSLFKNYFPKLQISHSYFHAQHVQELPSLIQPNTKCIYLETPTNPAIAIIDLETVAAVAKEKNVLLIVDNCFATPYIQQPIRWGADLVIHSATKYMDGQGRVLGGVVVGKASLIRDIYLFGRLTGPALSPMNAWMLSKSLETLAIRMDRHAENAHFIAEQLEHHSALSDVSYPFLPSHPQYDIAKKQMKLGGGMVTITLHGGYEAAKLFLNRLQMIKISPNLGDSRTIATHPASSTHSKLSEEDRRTVGITPGLVRLSIGLEHRDDILRDILQALETNVG